MTYSYISKGYVAIFVLHINHMLILREPEGKPAYLAL